MQKKNKIIKKKYYNTPLLYNNSADNPFLYKPTEISETFAAFYKNLYSDIDICSEAEQIESYLDKTDLPKMDL